MKIFFLFAALSLSLVFIARAGVPQSHQSLDALPSHVSKYFGSVQVQCVSNFNRINDSLQTVSYLHLVGYNNAIYDWQFIETKITFFFVMFMVFIGLLFAGIQFYLGFKHLASPQPPNANELNNKEENEETLNKIEANASSNLTEIDVSMHEVKFKSSVFGIIILFISFLFYISYMIWVYPIK